MYLKGVKLNNKILGGSINDTTIKIIKVLFQYFFIIIVEFNILSKNGFYNKYLQNFVLIL